MRHRRPRPAPRHRARPPEERSLTGPPEPRFLGSFPRADVALDPTLPEIGFLGRSNVGKSTLLNAVLGRRLAKVSGTPGKTRMLNVYVLPSLYFLDLPGYGYARASKEERAGFRRLVAHTLERARLAGVVWLLDMRRDPSADDLAMLDVLSTHETRVLAALTKSDKLARGRREQRERELVSQLGLEQDQAIATSAKTGEGIVELREAIHGLVEGGTAVRR
jgi:GTP-binding protein